MEKLDSSPLHTPTPPINQHQLPRTNCAVTSRGGAAAHGLTDTGRRMLGSACPTPPSALRLGKARRRWAEGQPEAWGRGGKKGEARGGAGRAGPSLLLLLEPVKLHSHFPQELPFHLPAPGACKTASVCLQRLSSPCATSLPVPLQLRAPGRGRPALVLPEAEGGGGRWAERRGEVRGFWGILGIRLAPCGGFGQRLCAEGLTGAGLGSSPRDRPPRERGSHRAPEQGARRRGQPPDSRRFLGPGEFPDGLRLGDRSEARGRGKSLNSCNFNQTPFRRGFYPSIQCRVGLYSVCLTHWKEMK